MLRLLLASSLAISGMARAGEPRTSDETCEPIILEPTEFTLAGYDAARGIAAISCPEHLPASPDRPFPLRLHGAEHPFLLPMSAETLAAVLDDRAAGRLRLVVDVKRALPMVAPAVQGCEDVVAMAMRLEETEEVPLASVRLDAPLPVAPPSTGSVRVGVVTADSESPSVTSAPIEATTRAIAMRCAEGIAVKRGAVQGALTVELKTSPIGTPEAPQIVVDGLVEPQVSRCLLQGLERSPELWTHIPAGARVFVPLYFRLAPVEPSSPSLLDPQMADAAVDAAN